MADSLFEALRGEARRASEGVVLISPFVKVKILDGIVDAAQSDVPVSLITRWRPDEVASGVSDIETWHVMNAREGGALRLCGRLHAKCFIFDNTAWVGSANLTMRGTGAHSHSNLEFCTAVESQDGAVVRLLDAVYLESSPATYEDYIRCRDAAAAMPKAVRREPATVDDVGAIEMRALWLPETRYPDQLFRVYCGNDSDVTRASRESAIRDLSSLEVPGGLDEAQFNLVMCTRIFAHRFFARIAETARTPRRFGHYRTLVRDYLRENSIDRDPTQVWQTALRWILHFAGDEYSIETPRYSEILHRKVRRDPAREIASAVGSLRVDVDEGLRLPYKVLLLLMLLKRADVGLDSALVFGETEAELRRWMTELAPCRGPVDPRLPFWHLQSSGLWKVDCPGERVPGVADRRPTLMAMRASARGWVPEELWDELRRNMYLRRYLARKLLAEYWPAGERAAVVAKLGLSSIIGANESQ